jgi:hypothetical protein
VYAGLVALPDRDAPAANPWPPVTGEARDRMVAATVMACEFLVELLEAARADSHPVSRVGCHVCPGRAPTCAASRSAATAGTPSTGFMPPFTPRKLLPHGDHQ